MKLWKDLTLDYMTVESDDPDDASLIIEHQLTWRSESDLLYVDVESV